MGASENNTGIGRAQGPHQTATKLGYAATKSAWQAVMPLIVPDQNACNDMRQAIRTLMTQGVKAFSDEGFAELPQYALLSL